MREKLLEAFGGLVDSTIAALPKVVVGILLVVAAVLVAKVMERALRYTLTKAHLDELVQKTGIDQVLHRLGIRQKLTFLLPRVAYFLILLILAQTAGDALGLAAISRGIGAFFAYLPNIVAAILIIILGSIVGQFAGQTISQSAESSGIEFAPALGKVVSGGILFVCVMMALAQLNIDTDMVRIVTVFVLGAGALAFGLSFGLGTRDIVRSLTMGFYARKILTIGKTLDVAGQKGVLTAITATHLVLDDNGQEASVSNTALLDHVARQ